MATATQKLAVLITPAAAIVAAWALVDMGPPTKHPHRTWFQVMHPERAGGRKGTTAAKPEGDADGAAALAAAAGKEGAAGGADGAKVPPEKTASGEKKPETPSKTAEGTAAKSPPAKPEKGDGVDYPVPSNLHLPVCNSAGPLTFDTAHRLDLVIGSQGSFTLKGQWADEGMLKTALEAGASFGHLLYIAADERGTWDGVLGAAGTAAAAGWKNIGLVVVKESARSKGAFLSLAPAPAGEPEEPSLVVVSSGASSATFTVAGETVTEDGELEKRIRQIHDDYVAMIDPKYAESVDTTAWVLDGRGATTSAVVRAMDALRRAGVNAVRIQGISRPGE